MKKVGVTLVMRGLFVFTVALEAENHENMSNHS